MTKLDIISIIIFFICWIGYEPFLILISRKSGVIVKDLSIVRANWMLRLVNRDIRLFDANLLGHGVNSASFFASANLILIAAVAGALFGNEIPKSVVENLRFTMVSAEFLDVKFLLVLLCLGRGLLNFIWAIRQMNYCAAAFGAIPENLTKDETEKYAQALSNIIEPSMSSFSQGVRSYYFALSAALWVFGPIIFILASLGAITLLSWRQSSSKASIGLRQLRILLENHKT